MKKIIKKAATPAEMAKDLSDLFNDLQNTIKPLFFTIQLAWRQLEYLITLDKEVKLVGNIDLSDFLIDTKRVEINNSQPFELLDGDLLEMPKDIFKKIFAGITDRVAVISIVGPQSSGKSTLLNFLFGCDFGTSQGRCTRGVYGSYFKFSKDFMSNCDGVFLIDTEGLFASLNKNEENKRLDFDSKLMLFCLTVSNFVIINTKGNLDSESLKILKSSMERFEVLQQNTEWPQMFLTLNQNNSANMTTSEAEINKLREIIKFQNSFSLNQAYNLTQLGKNEIQMLPQNQNLIKKQSRKQFLVLTNQLQRCIIDKIQNKSNFKSISEVIDLMEQMWSTIEAFPDLGRTISKNMAEIYNQIRFWRIKEIDYLSKTKEEIFKEFKNNNITKDQCLKLFQQKIQKSDAEFHEVFLSQKWRKLMTSQETIKVEFEYDNIKSVFSISKRQLNYQIMALEKDQMVQKCKLQGSQDEKEAIRKVKQLQRYQKKELSDSEKEKYFDKAFNKSLESIQKRIAPQEQLNMYFSRICEFYSNAHNVFTNMKNVGLPKDKWSLEIDTDYKQFAQKIKLNIFRVIGKQVHKFIEFRKNPPTKILDENVRTDAKLEYFNMRNYFFKNKRNIYFEISIDQLPKCLKMELVKQQISKILEKNISFDGLIAKIFQRINICMLKYGFSLQSLDNFKDCYEYECHENVLPYFKKKPTLKLRFLQVSGRQANNVNKKQKQFMFKSQQTEINNFLYLDIFQEKIENLQRFPFYKKIFKKIISYDLQLQIIKWVNIKNYIKESRQYQIISRKINQKINNSLNKDLSLFGVSVSCDNFYGFIFLQDNEVQMKFKRIQKIRVFEQQTDFYNILKRLSIFDEGKIKMKLKKSHHETPTQYKLQMGAYFEEFFEVKPEYTKTRSLQTYISNQSSELYSSLQSEDLKDFVFNELINNNVLEKLFYNIDDIITRTPDYLTHDIVGIIYVDISKQITQFNNDLNQVSHKLTILFTGYVHLYAIYLIWKNFSVTALKEANQPYFKMLETREEKLNFFLLQTSNNDNTKSEGQSDRFLSEVIEFFKDFIQIHKDKRNQNQAKLFRQNYLREKIQKQIDQQMFNQNSNFADLMQYLDNPASVLEQKYKQFTEKSISNLVDQYQNFQGLPQLLKQFKQIIKQLLQKLKSVGVTQDTMHTDIFRISRNTQKQISVTDLFVVQIINSIAMKYLLDLLTKQQKQTYAQKIFNLEINQKYKEIKIKRELSLHLINLFKHMKQKKMSITRLYIFLEMIYNKIKQKQIINSVEVGKFQARIKKLLTVTPEDQKAFRSLVTVKICTELCPGCHRICGVMQPHVNKHQCIYGHQMRALSGVKFSNGEASVIRCENVPLTSLLSFNGRVMTWQQFKELWENRLEGSWTFQDLKDNNNNKQPFNKAWDIVGERICKKYDMKFVKHNDLQKQMLQSEPIHYIFALDDSGSMDGKKWDGLKESFSKAIDAIRKIPDSEKYIKISILIFNSTCLLFQQNVPPYEVNLRLLYRGGGTNFANPFQQAYNLMVKYVATSKINFVFMTDGESSYPQKQINQIKALKNKQVHKIKYFSIEFQANADIMKKICKELDGINSIAMNVVELTKIYIEIINRKQVKELDINPINNFKKE